MPHPLRKWSILSLKDTSKVYHSQNTEKKSSNETICLQTHVREISIPASYHQLSVLIFSYLNAPISTRRKRTASQNSRVAYFPSNKHSKVKWHWQNAFFSLLANTLSGAIRSNCLFLICHDESVNYCPGNSFWYSLGLYHGMVSHFAANNKKMLIDLCSLTPGDVICV